MSVPASRQPNPAFHRTKLQHFFIYFLIRQKAYQEACDELGPLWAAACKDHEKLNSKPQYQHLPHLNDGTDSLVRYRVRLDVVVAEELRCRAKGQPAAWVCNAVHGGVTGGVISPKFDVEGALIRGILDIPVFTFGGAAISHRIWPSPYAEEEAIETRPMEPFSGWKRLRKNAHRRLDALLDDMQLAQDNYARDWPRLYERGINTRIFTTMPKLVDWIVGGEEMFLGDRSATHDLLKELGLDPPVRPKIAA